MPPKERAKFTSRPTEAKCEAAGDRRQTGHAKAYNCSRFEWLSGNFFKDYHIFLNRNSCGFIRIKFYGYV